MRQTQQRTISKENLVQWSLHGFSNIYIYFLPFFLLCTSIYNTFYVVIIFKNITNIFDVGEIASDTNNKRTKKWKIVENHHHRRRRKLNIKILILKNVFNFWKIFHLQQHNQTFFHFPRFLGIALVYLKLKEIFFKTKFNYVFLCVTMRGDFAIFFFSVLLWSFSLHTFDTLDEEKFKRRFFFSSQWQYFH